MLDESAIDDLGRRLSDRFTPEELMEVLVEKFNISTQYVYEMFLDECLELDWSELL